MLSIKHYTIPYSHATNAATAIYNAYMYVGIHVMHKLQILLAIWTICMHKCIRITCLEWVSQSCVAQSMKLESKLDIIDLNK